MDRWNGKVAIVSGASSGIGMAIVTSLVDHGVKVVGLARRMDKLQELSVKLGKDKLCPVQCDVTKEDDILKMFKSVEAKFGGAQILINNAGVAHYSMVIEMPTEECRRVMETNLMAPTIFAREFVQSCIKRKKSGHIININSVAGQFAESIHVPLGMYGPSKYALRALGTELRHELIQSKLPIKLTNISPGAVMTDMFKGMVRDENILQQIPKLQSKDIANAVIYTLGTPEGVEILEITVVPQYAPIGFSSTN